MKEPCGFTSTLCGHQESSRSPRRDTVVATGTIRVAEGNEASVGVESLSSPSDALTYDLSAEDIYKELRLRGYEYEGLFRGILKADLHTPSGKLQWDGNWVSFIDTMLQVTLLASAKRSFKLPTRIQSCCINPAIHFSVAEKARESGEYRDFSFCIDVVYEDSINTCQAGGITIRGLKASVATKRVVNHTPIINEYRFVPYIDSELTKMERQACIQEYLDICNRTAEDVIKTLSSNESQASKLPKQTSHAREKNLKKFLDANAQSHGLLKVLARFEEEVENPLR
ncbi:hypothetical protein HPB50_025689 [Hyalomma asiaticum]|uniref:Uncharacterized protein n=1 Tax=Hyalomma asiaticum TaxID=266040 RepID=A0ACB7SI96_HYAAI|nr:hypothetical protein HPB50_025689 [Hyalomma asiaticum]